MSAAGKTWGYLVCLVNESPNHFMGHEIAICEYGGPRLTSSQMAALTSHLTPAGVREVKDGTALTLSFWGFLNASSAAREFATGALADGGMIGRFSERVALAYDRMARNG